MGASMPKPVEAVLVGAGRRGSYNFGQYALSHPDELRYVAVAEPNQTLRERFARAHEIPPERCFQSWEELAARGQLAPVMVNSSNDTTHYASTIAALDSGYDVLLEKPMATTPAECVSLVEATGRTGRNIWVYYEARNTDFFTKVARVVQSGRLGGIVAVQHQENVAYWHMAHSFIRGNWADSKTSGPMILTKCCHDMDLLTWIMGRKAVRLSSFGSLLHFRPDQAPHPEIPERCTDGCPIEEECPFYAPRLYLGDFMGALTNAVSLESDNASRLEALRTGPYGRCVYHSYNDVVDHQTVNMEFEGELTVTLIMHGHSHQEGRTMRYDGARATLLGKYTKVGPGISVHDHRSEKVERVPTHVGDSHGGGDQRLMAAFVRTVRGQDSEPLCTAEEALESHLMCFAAEESRVRNGAVIEMEAYRQEANAAAAAT